MVSAAGSGAVVDCGAGEAGVKLSPLEAGAGSRTVDRRRGCSDTGAGEGADVSVVTGGESAGASAAGS